VVDLRLITKTLASFQRRAPRAVSASAAPSHQSPRRPSSASVPVFLADRHRFAQDV
jgi:hypothetical protein